MRGSQSEPRHARERDGGAACAHLGPFAGFGPLLRCQAAGFVATHMRAKGGPRETRREDGQRQKPGGREKGVRVRSPRLPACRMTSRLHNSVASLQDDRGGARKRCVRDARRASVLKGPAIAKTGPYGPAADGDPPMIYKDPRKRLAISRGFLGRRGGTPRGRQGPARACTATR